MKILMSSVVNCKVLTKSELPWEMEGRSGVSYRLGIMVVDDKGNPDIDKIRASKDLYESVQLGSDYTLLAEVTVNAGKVNLLFTGIL